MIKLGCCVSLRELQAACRIGYDFIDLSGAELAALSYGQVEELSRSLRQQGISCIGLHAAILPEIALAGEAYSEKRIREYAENLIPKAKELGAAFLGIGSPASRKLPPGFDRAKAEEQLLCSLEILGSESAGIDILLESLNPEETNYINTLPEAYEVLAKSELKNKGLVWDLYHFTKSGERLDSVTGEIAGRVEYLHIADPQKRAYPSAATEDALFLLMKAAVEMTNSKYIAIEAVGNEFCEEAETGYHTMLEMFKKFGWR